MMIENKSCPDCGEQQTYQVPAASPGAPTYDPTLEIQATKEFLAFQMTQLSYEERNEAIYDLHCVGGELVETPDMVDKLLAEFDYAIKHQKNETYQLAVAQNRSYVEDPAFRLKFLRANMHDVSRAVRQMVSFLEQKAVHFGIEKVAQHITIDDLTNEEREFMQSSGSFRISEGRDRSGRVVVYLTNPSVGQDHCTPETLVR